MECEQCKSAFTFLIFITSSKWTKGIRSHLF
jgi:hypothetical protein